MRINGRVLLALMTLFCAAGGFAHGNVDLTLNDSQWRVHAKAAAGSKKAGTLPFDEELLFQKGVLTTPLLQKQGFEPARYQSGGVETFLNWNCEQTNPSGEKVVWEGIANRQRKGAWKIEGSFKRIFPDGRVDAYTFKGKGEPLPVIH